MSLALLLTIVMTPWSSFLERYILVAVSSSFVNLLMFMFLLLFVLRNVYKE